MIPEPDADRPVVLFSPDDAELQAKVRDELAKGPTAGSYELSLLTFLVNHLGITPQAAIAQALAHYAKRVTGGTPRRPRKRNAQ